MQRTLDRFEGERESERDAKKTVTTIKRGVEDKKTVSGKRKGGYVDKENKSK